jgi:phosphatidylinositol alpha-1,6-mannosyltransferase
MARHLLVTNDFPPKLGGIQSYLWELWRRLDPADFSVLTTPYGGAAVFDAAQDFEVVRDKDRVLLPTPGLVRRIDAHAARIDADLVIFDPVLPVGFLGPRIERPYGVVVHGAEVTVAAQARLGRLAMAKVLRGARLVVAAGSFPAAEAERVARRSLPVVNIPPGVDPERFHPLDMASRAAARRRLGVPESATVVVSLSRLVPRKGMDVLIEASARLAGELPDLCVVIGGTGRDRSRLERLVRGTGAPVRLLGRVLDDELADLHASADVFAMLCRNRWGGLEQEGFGIVFLEAAACGVPQVAGRSGGSADAVEHEQTGLIVEEPTSVGDVTAALRRLLVDPALRAELGDRARRRAVDVFSYDVLAVQLAEAIDATVAVGA